MLLNLFKLSSFKPNKLTRKNKLTVVLFVSFLFSTGVTFSQNYNEVVRTSYITIRREAKFNSVIVAKKMRGDKFRKVFEDRNWIKVEFQDGTTGWLFKTLANRQLEDPIEKEEESKCETKETAKVDKKDEKPADKKEVKEKEPAKKVETAKKVTEKPKVAETPKKKQEPVATKPAPQAPAKKPNLVSDTSLNAEDLYNKAITLYEKGKYKEALELNLMATKKAPKNAEIINNIGNCLFKLNKGQEALDYWYAALKLAPRSGKICNNIGIALYQLDKPLEAIEYYKKAITFEPDFSDTYYNLASAYGYIGNFENAIKNYKSFLDQSQDEVMRKLAEDRIDYCETLLAGK